VSYLSARFVGSCRTPAIIGFAEYAGNMKTPGRRTALTPRPAHRRPVLTPRAARCRAPLPRAGRRRFRTVAAAALLPTPAARRAHEPRTYADED
jgi:hypothetical protein